MFRFAQPEYFYLLLVVPLLVGVYWLTNRRSHQRLRRFGNPALLLSLVPNRSAHRRWIKFSLLLACVMALVAMIARPQTGLKEVEETKKGIEIAFLIDVSNSMLATDANPNRLERAKLLVNTLIDRLPNDKIALGVFAGEAYPQLPMTTDHAAAKLFLDALSTDMVTLQGTNIAAAIEVGMSSFSEQNKGGKALVIITDGENHEAGAQEAAEQAAKSGVNVYVLGIGTEKGGVIPTEQGPLKDENGQVVTTSLNIKAAQDLAKAGKGLYISVDNSMTAGEQLETAFRSLKQSASSTLYAEYAEQFTAFGCLALLLLIVEFALSETQSTWLNKFNLFERRPLTSKGKQL